MGCTGCGIVKQHPIPSGGELAAYYDREYAEGLYETFAASAEMKRRTADWRLDRLAKHIPLGGEWLDVGAADGAFVDAAARRGIDAQGIELSSVAVRLAEKAGRKVRQGSLEDIADDEQFDVVTAFDIVEHVPDPMQLVTDMARRLTPDGYLALTLPDKDSVFSRVMGARWWHYIPVEHLHTFGRKAMRALLERAGLRVTHQGRFFKPLTYNYGLTQFREYNPLIYRVLTSAGRALPENIKEAVLPLYIGEMLVVATR